MPDTARHEILAFLGADPKQESGAISADYNRKAGYAKLAPTELAQAILIEHFQDELKQSAVVFGGAARQWATRYGV